MKRITKIAENTSLGKKTIRVAAYCRVSTASEEQLVSLAAQKAHYENYIKSNDDWEFAGLLQSLRGLNDQSRLLKIEELETAIEKNREQKQVLTNLMASGYLEPALFNKESNELAAEAETLRQEKEGLMRSVNGDMVKVEELQRLLRFTSKGTMLTEFDDETFLSFVERITVLSRKEVVFELKCGLSLRERLVEP